MLIPECLRAFHRSVTKDKTICARNFATNIIHRITDTLARPDNVEKRHLLTELVFIIRIVGMGYNDSFLPGVQLNDIGQTRNDSNLLIVFYVQIMPDDFVMQLHRF